MALSDESRRPVVELRGTPHEVDAVLRPLARIVQLTLGGLATVALLVSPWWTWAPVPLALSFLLYEAFFWWRGDRPVVLVLGRYIGILDRRADVQVALKPSDVHAVTLHARTRGPTQQELVVVMADHHEVQLALRFLTGLHVELPEQVVDADAMDELLGGYGGLLAAVAHGEARCRQTFVDPDGEAVEWLRAALPAEAWNRCAVRVWRGAAPSLDPFGLHTDAPSGLLLLEDDVWTLTEQGQVQAGAVTLIRAERATRSLTLARRGRPDEGEDASEPVFETVDLPLLVLELDDQVRLAMPAPIAGMAGTHRGLDDALLHAHVPEGGALLWHLLRRWPPSAWPAPIRRQAKHLLADHESSDTRTARSTPEEA